MLVMNLCRLIVCHVRESLFVLVTSKIVADVYRLDILQDMLQCTK